MLGHLVSTVASLSPLNLLNHSKTCRSNKHPPPQISLTNEKGYGQTNRNAALKVGSGKFSFGSEHMISDILQSHRHSRVEKLFSSLHHFTN